MWLHAPHICGFFDPKIFLTRRVFWPEKIFEPKNYLTWKFFWPKKFFDPRSFLTQKSFWPKKVCWPKKVFDPKKFFNPKKFFDLKMIFNLKFFSTQKHLFLWLPICAYFNFFCFFHLWHKQVLEDPLLQKTKLILSGID